MSKRGAIANSDDKPIPVPIMSHEEPVPKMAPRKQKPTSCVIEKQMTRLDGTQVTIKLQPGLDLHPDVLKHAAAMAIQRLQTMQRDDGFVVLLAFSHTAVNSKIHGKKLSDNMQRFEASHTLLTTGAPPTHEPDAACLTLGAVDRFKPPEKMNLAKLNIAGIGAKSCMCASANLDVEITDENYFLKIFHTVRDNIGSRDTILQNVIAEMNLTFLEDAKNWYDRFVKPTYAMITKRYETHCRRLKLPASTTFDMLTKKAQKQISASKYEKIVEAAQYDIHNANLTSNPQSALMIHTSTSTNKNVDCMLDKEFLRDDKVNSHVEYYPSLDWHITVVDNAGNIIIGNLLLHDFLTHHAKSTQIPQDVHVAIMQGFPSGHPLQTQQIWAASWMMDLITLIKISEGVDTVTTSIILNFLHDKGILNVFFIDGGCNVFYDNGTMIACGPCDSALNTPCINCNTIMRDHALGGGMKNKKPKKPKTTKKKATVRGRRMRKSYKRYKRSKTYKR
jgi:hypothetical protein